MPLHSKSAASSSSLLTVESAAGCWAFPSAAVLGVETNDEHPNDEPDLLALLGAGSSQALGGARVLLLAADGAQRRVRVHGALKLLDGVGVELLPLPPEVRAVSPLLSHVAVLEGKPTCFVISPERLLASLPRDPLSTSPSSPAAVRGT